jgi:hypothetical protein
MGDSPVRSCHAAREPVSWRWDRAGRELVAASAVIIAVVGYLIINGLLMR